MEELKKTVLILTKATKYNAITLQNILKILIIIVIQNLILLALALIQLNII